MWSLSPSKLWFRCQFPTDSTMKVSIQLLKHAFFMAIYNIFHFQVICRKLYLRQSSCPPGLTLASEMPHQSSSQWDHVLQSGKWIWPGASDVFPATKGRKKCLPDCMTNLMWVFHVYCILENSLTMEVIKCLWILKQHWCLSLKGNKIFGIFCSLYVLSTSQ